MNYWEVQTLTDSGRKDRPQLTTTLMDGWMDDLYLNTIKIKATSLWGRV